MDNLYSKRNVATAMCAVETQTAERFAAAAERLAAEGRVSAAWKAIDTARCAVTCAMQAHDALWEAADGELTETEWEAFAGAESVKTIVHRAVRAVASAATKAQAACDAAIN